MRAHDYLKPHKNEKRALHPEPTGAHGQSKAAEAMEKHETRRKRKNQQKGARGRTGAAATPAG